MLAPACIRIASSSVPAATAVPPSALCVEKPLQHLGPIPATTALAPAPLPASSAVAVRPLISPDSEAAAITYHASPCTESSSSSLGHASLTNALALAPDHLDPDLILAVAMTTASTIQHAPCINSFLEVKQRPTLPPLPATVNHPTLLMLKKYAELGCPLL